MHLNVWIRIFHYLAVVDKTPPIPVPVLFTHWLTSYAPMLQKTCEQVNSTESTAGSSKWICISSLECSSKPVLSLQQTTCHKGETVQSISSYYSWNVGRLLVIILPNQIMRVGESVPLATTNQFGSKTQWNKVSLLKRRKMSQIHHIRMRCVLGVLVKGWCLPFDEILGYEISAMIRWNSCLFIFGHYVTNRQRAELANSAFHNKRHADVVFMIHVRVLHTDMKFITIWLWEITKLQ